MRHDMKDLAVNTGRYGKGPRRNMNRRVEFEDLPDKEPMRDGIDWITQGDRLQPWYRFLDKQVGRPWSKVYSEICAHIDRRSLRGVHMMRDHFDVDSRDLSEIGGRYFWQHGAYYIDSNDIFRKYKERRRYTGPPKNTDPDTIPIKGEFSRYEVSFGSVVYRQSKDGGPVECYERIDGIWYHMLYEVVQKDRRERPDRRLYGYSYTSIRQVLDTDGGAPLYNVVTYNVLVLSRKKQLSKRELKKANLKNQ